MITTKKTPTAKQSKGSNLCIYVPLSLVPDKRTTCIPKVRMAIREQLKMLRSFSTAIVIMGIFNEFLYCMGLEPWKALFGEYLALVQCVTGFAMALLSLFMAFIIRSTIWEISDLMKTLNDEVA